MHSNSTSQSISASTNVHEEICYVAERILVHFQGQEDQFQAAETSSLGKA
jgi:hypothetical protein